MDRSDRSYPAEVETVTTSEAKARLNALLAKVAQTGEPVMITGRGKPLAVLSAVTAKTRRCGQFAGVVSYRDDFDEPLSAEEIASWEAGAT